MTHPLPADREIARAVALRERLTTAADRLEALAAELVEEVRLLRHATTDAEGENDAGTGTVPGPTDPTG